MIQNWFTVTTNAERDWNSALWNYHDMWQRVRGCPVREAQSTAWLKAQRAEYRHRVLSWYRKLCLPMELGDEVPDEVASLLAEEWEIATCWSSFSCAK